MKCKLKLAFILFIMLSSPLAKPDQKVSLSTVYGDVLIYRPIGFAMTMTGTAIFVAISPMLAIGNFAPPHDAFDDSFRMLVETPFNFTFNRPIGVMKSDRDGVYRRH